MSCFINRISLSCGSRLVPYGIGTKKKVLSSLLGSRLTLSYILKLVHLSLCFSKFFCIPPFCLIVLFRGCSSCWDSHPNCLLLLHCPQLLSISSFQALFLGSNFYMFDYLTSFVSPLCFMSIIFCIISANVS